MDYFKDKLKFAAYILAVCLLVCWDVPRAHASDSPALLYRSANRAYVDLCRDASRKRVRDNWVRVIDAYMVVPVKYPDSDFAPEAYYKGAKVNEHLSRYSGRKDDMKTASLSYQDMAGKYPESGLAAEALYNAGLLEEKAGNRGKAYELFNRVVREYGQGDMAERAREKLSEKPASEDTPRNQPAETRKEKSPVGEAEGVPSGKSLGKPSTRAGEKAKEKPAEKPSNKRKIEDQDGKTSDATLFVRNIRCWQTQDNTRVVIDLDEDTLNYKTFVLPGTRTDEKAYRLVVDISGAKVAASVPPRRKVDEGVLANIRVSQNPGNKVRVVLDLKGKPFFETFTMDDPSRIVIDVGNSSSSIKALSSYQSKVRKVPKGTPARIREDAPSLASQLCLKVSRIVIDPGHGGKDPGAISPNGIMEKDITLEIGRQLYKRLKSDGFEVFLTRNRDEFLTLEERTIFANRKRADLFVSIHINSHQNSSVSGIETYFLNLTTDSSAIAVAARENASAQRSMSDLQLILNDLMLNTKINESSKFASCVHTSVVSSAFNIGYEGKNLGVKQAPFYVLLGAQMPSILLELGFITNTTDVGLLKRHAYQTTLVDGIAKGINNYIMNTTYAYSWRSK